MIIRDLTHFEALVGIVLKDLDPVNLLLLVALRLLSQDSIELQPLRSREAHFGRSQHQLTLFDRDQMRFLRVCFHLGLCMRPDVCKLLPKSAVGLRYFLGNEW